MSTSTVNVVHSNTDPTEADVKEIIKKEAETGDSLNTEDEEYYNEYDLTTTVAAPTTKSERPATAEKTTKTTTLTTATTPMAVKISGATIGMYNKLYIFKHQSFRLCSKKLYCIYFGSRWLQRLLTKML